MIKKIALMAGVFALVMSVAASPGLPKKAALAATNPLVISAVQTTGGEGKTNDDFVEFYNPNPEPFNLNGYRLVKRSGAGTTDSSIKSWSADTFVPAYSFYLWANSGFTAITAAPDTTTSSTLADNNGVALRFGANDAGTLIDSVAWGTTTNGFASSGLANPTAGQSVVRKSLFENLGYSLANSAPRNSTKKVLPDVPEVPTTPPIPIPPKDPIDNASCAVVDSASGAENAQINSVVFTNTGDTTWSTPKYIVDGTNSDDFALTANQSIAPGGKLNLDLLIPIPITGGKHTYEWQMANSTVKFGQKCTLELSFEDVPVQQPTEETPEPQPEQPPQPETPPVVPSVPGNNEATDQAVTITELLINPDGKDDGQEKVELYNSSDSKINLTNWILDDIKAGSVVTSDKYVLPATEINAKSYLVITLPAGKAVLNNTKGDVMSIINKTGEFIDTVEYTVASSPEGKTLSLVGGEWIWTTPSLGSVNVAPVEDTPADDEEDDQTPEQPTNVDVNDLEISEIYAAPAKGEVEFLELFNAGDKKINLSNVTLKIDDKIKVLSDIELLPGKYLALKDSQLTLALLDKGAQVQLLEKDGSKIFEVAYEKAFKGQSYSQIDEKFVWTTTPTPGEVNKLTVPPVVNKDKTVVTKKVTTTTKTTPTKTTTTKKAVVKKTTTSPAAVKSSTSLPKTNSLISTNDNVAHSDSQQEGNKKGKKGVNTIAMILASLGAGTFAIYKFGFGGF